ncbi:MAG TPA: c-type cytochrome [Steroidobacteraceae bacterium]|nr:c-type cytochrome [Steroidobacteraceae bacterium]
MNKGVLVAVAVASLGFGGAALADAAAAKAKFESVCADCHETKDFAGKAAADLETKIKAISAGTMKHKGKFKVSDAEAKDLAAFLAAGK